MIDRDCIVSKMAKIERRLDRINEKKQSSQNLLTDFDAQDVVILNLQRAIQLTIDIAFYVVASGKLGLPAQVRDAFMNLYEKGWIDHEMALRMIEMTHFRNIATHDYDQLDFSVLTSVLEKHLTDFIDFGQTILDQLQQRSASHKT